MIKKIICTVISVFLITVSIGLLSSCEKKAERKTAEYIFEITILKTGKSDSIILKSQNTTLLIDTADRDSARKITRYLSETGVKKIDCIIITHFDSDHIGGFQTIADRIRIENIIRPSYADSTEVYKKFIEKLGEKNINVITAQKNISFSVDDLEFKIYSTKTEFENNNNRSLITSAVHGEKNFLFAGDIGSERCMEILQSDIKNYDFLKIPHHGIFFESAEEFYKAVSPNTAVITDDDTIDSSKTEELLHLLNTNIYHTKDGIIKIISDGKEIKALQE